MDLFFGFTLDASTSTSCWAAAPTSLRQPKCAFVDAFNCVQRFRRHRRARRRLQLSALPRGKFNKQLDTVMNRFVEPYIEEALLLSQEELEKRTKSDEGYTFLHALAAFMRATCKVLRDQLRRRAAGRPGHDSVHAVVALLQLVQASPESMVKKLARRDPRPRRARRPAPRTTISSR